MAMNSLLLRLVLEQLLKSKSLNHAHIASCLIDRVSKDGQHQTIESYTQPHCKLSRIAVTSRSFGHFIGHPVSRSRFETSSGLLVAHSTNSILLIQHLIFLSFVLIPYYTFFLQNRSLGIQSLAVLKAGL